MCEHTQGYLFVLRAYRLYVSIVLCCVRSLLENWHRLGAGNFRGKELAEGEIGEGRTILDDILTVQAMAVGKAGESNSGSASCRAVCSKSRVLPFPHAQE